MKAERRERCQKYNNLNEKYLARKQNKETSESGESEDSASQSDSDSDDDGHEYALKNGSDLADQDFC